MSLKASEIIRVTSSIAPQGLIRRETGRCLFLTKDATIPIQERVRNYTSFDGVKEDFDVDSSPYKAGRIHFSAEPYPKNFMVGRWSESQNELAVINGGLMPALIDDFVAITSGSFKIRANQVPEYTDQPVTEYEITGLDFSGASDFADVETIIEAALTTALSPVADDVTVSLADSGSKIELSVEDETKILAISFLEEASTGTDISSLLSMTIELGESVHYSTVAETVEEALDCIVDRDPSFTFICEDIDISDTETVEDISSWCQASRVYMLSTSSVALAFLSKTPDTTFDKLLKREPSNTFGTFSRTADYKHVAAAARLSSVNFSQSNSLITMMYKILQGTLTDDYTSTEAKNILEQGANFYSRRSGVAMYESGQTFNPNYWIDTKYWMIWFENACLAAVFNVLYQSPKLAQTEGGMAVIKQALELVCDEGARNGGIAAGQLSPALTNDIQLVTGSAKFDGFLDKGYLIYSEPIALQNQSDRNSRKAPPVKVWLKGAGAIQYVEAAVVFEQ